jgi:glycosyltransferase involved in cell wall biosynthesis
MSIELFGLNEFIVRIALIADTFTPLRTSGAVQLRDLSREFARQGHSVCVLLPSSDQSESWMLESFDGAQVLRLKAPRTKDIGYLRRTLAELAMPFAMLRNFGKSPFSNERWDGVVWYSPSIFHGPLASALKKSSGCKSYLIIRDIFPEWAVDMGLMGRGLPYRFFDAVARFQYSVADVIGVQTPGNQRYFDQWVKRPDRRLEVLQNWLAKPGQVRCSIRVAETAIAGRKVFVYAGNMGVAQGMDILLDLAEKLSSRPDVGFLFVGRGSGTVRLKGVAHSRQLHNVVFFDEIDPDEIPDLYSQCHAGIVALDPRHKSHNIPGKFLTYMQSGLPVLANINSGNDLAKMIRDNEIGQVCETNRVGDLLRFAEQLLDQIETDTDISDRCLCLFEREFAVENIVKQIVAAMTVKEIRQQ